MSLYVKIETRILLDPRIRKAGPDGFSLYVKGLCYSKEFLTDGHIPADAVPIIGVGMRNLCKTCDRLVSLKLWVKVDDGFSVGKDNWSRHQTSKAQVDAEREAAKLRKRKSRLGHGVTGEGVTALSQVGHNPVTQPEPEPIVQSTEPEPEPGTPPIPQRGEARNLMPIELAEHLIQESPEEWRTAEYRDASTELIEMQHRKHGRAAWDSIQVTQNVRSWVESGFDSEEVIVAMRRTTQAGLRVVEPKKLPQREKSWTPMSIAAEIFGE